MWGTQTTSGHQENSGAIICSPLLECICSFPQIALVWWYRNSPRSLHEVPYTSKLIWDPHPYFHSGPLNLSDSGSKLAQTAFPAAFRTKPHWVINFLVCSKLREIWLLLLSTSLRLPYSPATCPWFLLLNWHLVAHSPWCTADGLGCPTPVQKNYTAINCTFSVCHPAVLQAITWKLLPCDLMRLFPKWSCNNFLKGWRIMSLPCCVWDSYTGSFL